MLGTSAEPFTADMTQQEEADFDSEDDCKIPLVVLSRPNHPQVNKILQVKYKTIAALPPAAQKNLFSFTHIGGFVKCWTEKVRFPKSKRGIIDFD